IGRQLALPEQHRRNDAKRENRLLTSHGTQRELPEKDEYAGDDERDRHDRLDAGGIVVAKRDHWARVPGMRHVRNWAWGHGAWGLGLGQEAPLTTTQLTIDGATDSQTLFVLVSGPCPEPHAP